jgi:uncharacterized protein (TIGR03382 family)
VPPSVVARGVDTVGGGGCSASGVDEGGPTLCLGIWLVLPWIRRRRSRR